MGWIIAGSVLGGLIVLYIIVTLIMKAKESSDNLKHATLVMSHFKAGRYKETAKALFYNDIPKVISVDDFLKCLMSDQFTVCEVFENLRKQSLLKLPESVMSARYGMQKVIINGNVPTFIFELTKKVVYANDVQQILILHEILNIVRRYFDSSVKREYAPIDSAFILTTTYIDKRNIKPLDDELLSYISKAKMSLGLNDENSGTARERAALRRSYETKMNRAEASAKRRTDHLENRKIELNDEIKEYEDKLRALEEREKRDDLILKDAREKVAVYEKQISDLIEILKTESNKKLFPYLANVIADLKTIEIQKTADALNWGEDQVRLKKAKSLIEIRKEVKEQLEDAQVSYYQLKYLLELFPSLQDILDAEYGDIAFDLHNFDYNESDPVRHFMSHEEWQSLSESERNQLALDRYIASHSKNNWQIGRDYELFIGQRYQAEGYDVDFTGSYMGLEDMGRDLICKKGDETLIIQCKYWSKDKLIHENHINQLFGTMTSYCIEHRLSPKKVKGVFITNTKLSDTATKFADLLKISIVQDKKMEEFPRIKCNIGVDEYGQPTKIYHLPMDLSYDVAKIVNPGEFFAKTVKEAESAGFRRSYKWHGGDE